MKAAARIAVVLATLATIFAVASLARYVRQIESDNAALAKERNELRDRVDFLCWPAGDRR